MNLYTVHYFCWWCLYLKDGKYWSGHFTCKIYHIADMHSIFYTQTYLLWWQKSMFWSEIACIVSWITHDIGMRDEITKICNNTWDFSWFGMNLVVFTFPWRIMNLDQGIMVVQLDDMEMSDSLIERDGGFGLEIGSRLKMFLSKINIFLIIVYIH